MKRARECNEKIARLDEERNQLCQELTTLNEQLEHESREKVKADQEEFVRKRLLGLKRHVAPLLPNADPNYVPTTIGDCLSNGDLATIILIHLGPIELYYMTRVCTSLVDIVTRAFKEFAPLQLARFSVDYGTRIAMEARPVRAEMITRNVSILNAIIVDQRQEPTQRVFNTPTVSIGGMLSLWYHALVEHRGYLSTCAGDYARHSQRLVGKVNHSRDISFIYNTETRKCESLSCASVFVMTKFRDAEKKFDSRWTKKGYSFQLHATEKIRHFRKKELKKAKFTPKHHGFYATKDFVYVDTRRLALRRLGGKSSESLAIVDQNISFDVIKSSGAPFFDHCELNRLFAWRVRSLDVPFRLIVPFENLSLLAHIRAVGYGPLLDIK